VTSLPIHHVFLLKKENSFINARQLLT
jgi:hypothetical protein